MSEHVRVAVEWDGYNWIGVVAGGGTTQAGNLHKLRPNVVEVVKLMQQRDITVDEVDLDITAPGDAPDAARILQVMRARHDEQALMVQLQTLALAAQLKDGGFPLRDIAEMTGVSHQRVAQLLESGDDLRAELLQRIAEQGTRLERWEAKVLARPGATRRVAEIEEELRRKAGLTRQARRGRRSV